MSSSGLVYPSALSAARRGKDTSKVASLELVSSTWPEPCSRVPVQPVRAVRVGIGSPYSGVVKHSFPTLLPAPRAPCGSLPPAPFGRHVGWCHGDGETSRHGPRAGAHDLCPIRCDRRPG